MATDRLARVVARLQNLPSMSLPTDYPRPSGSSKVIEAAHVAEFSEQTAHSLLKLALFTENGDGDGDESEVQEHRPSAFHLLLAAFAVLLHRYTGDTDLIIGTSSSSARNPLVLRLSVDPTDPFWAVLRKLQQVEGEAESDALPYDTIIRALHKNQDDPSEGSSPLFRVRFFDATDEHDDTYVKSTSLTSDLTVFVTRPPASSRDSLAPRISLRILYNSLLFSHHRIAVMVDQLAVFLRKVGSNPLAPVGLVPLMTPGQRANLPDPTRDLHWCDWKGAITDVFTQNARRGPDRPCVVQSIPALNLDESQEKRTYSYDTIRRSSNILAHHLIRTGVQREEVVMVYADRSVELLVAVLAILKVGAIFSVIG